MHIVNSRNEIFSVIWILRYSKLKTIISATWFCLRLLSCGPGFESQAHHLSFVQFVLLKLKFVIEIGIRKGPK